MKGYRFYEELENKNRKGEISKGTVLAVFVYPTGRGYNPQWVNNSAECISALYDEENSPVCGLSVGWEYLRKKTRKISEERAREIHPALFAYLEN